MNCRDCQATVTPTDRFCPACGTPNANGKFQPKFGPAVKVREPQILMDRAPAGAPACPRCDRQIRQADDYCRGCGMELGGAWQAYERRLVIERRRAARRANAPYRSPGVVGVGLQTLLTCVGAMGTVSGLGHLWRYARTQHLLTAGPLDGELVQALDAVTAITVALAGAVAVFLFVWGRRALRNLPALAIPDESFTGSWARIVWCVPGANLYRPKQLADDLWRSGDAEIPPFSPDWRRGPAPLWSSVAYLAVAGAVSFGWLSHLVGSGEPMAAGVADAGAAAVVSALVAGLSGVLTATAAWTLQVLLRTISDRQDERAKAVHALEHPEASRSQGAAAVVSAAGIRPTALLVQPHNRQAVWGKY